MDFFGSILQVIFCSILVLAVGMWAYNNPGWLLLIAGWGAAAITLYTMPKKNKQDDGKVW